MTKQEKLDISASDQFKRHVRIHDIKEKTSRMHQNLISNWHSTHLKFFFFFNLDLKFLVNERKLNKRLFQAFHCGSL